MSGTRGDGTRDLGDPAAWDVGFTGSAATDLFGRSSSAALDVDDDARDDILIDQMKGDASTGAQAGVVYLYLGR